jgi:hypothetical protein
MWGFDQRSDAMTRSLRRLLTRIFDYAGVFPPARLKLADAFRNYMSYWRGADSWMLRRFLCLPAHLDELARLSAEYADADQYLDVSVVGRAAQNSEQFLELLRGDLQKLVHFGSNPKATPKPTLDLKLPASFEASLFMLALDEISAASQEIGPIVAYFEAKATDDLRERILKPLVKCKSYKDYYMYVGGFKLRCGGEEASAVPSAEQVAHALACCRDFVGLDMKLTAGLHHPIRLFDPGLQTHAHGFINLLMAGLLSKPPCCLPEVQLLSIVQDDDPSHFRFEDGGCGWMDHRVSLQEIQQLSPMIVAIGSCSFDEPRDDLKALGWW